MKYLRLFGSTSQRDAVLASIDYKILQKTEGVPGVGIMQGTGTPVPPVQTITVSVFAESDPESDPLGTESQGTVTINGGTASVTCRLNDVVTLEATPLAPYVFNTWYEGAMTGNVLSTETPAEITITSELMNIAASTGNVLYIVGSFAAPNYEFNVVSVPAGVGTYANVGTYPYGTNVTTEISNYDDVHYDFIGWSLTDSPDDIIQGYSYHYYDVTITDNTTLYAFYQRKS